MITITEAEARLARNIIKRSVELVQRLDERRRAGGELQREELGLVDAVSAYCSLKQAENMGLTIPQSVNEEAA
jgi:hypothetical protein